MESITFVLGLLVLAGWPALGLWVICSASNLSRLLIPPSETLTHLASRSQFFRTSKYLKSKNDFVSCPPRRPSLKSQGMRELVLSHRRTVAGRALDNSAKMKKSQ